MKTETVKPATHTPTPWTLLELNPFIFSGPEGEEIAVARTGGVMNNPKQEQANAAFIVRAVNSHEELLQSLKDVLSCYKRVWTDAGKDQNGSLYIGIAEKAIARAEGK